MFNVDESQYLTIIRTMLSKLKVLYPNKKYLYIPHGRDMLVSVREVCKECCFEYKKLNSCVDFFMKQECITPDAIYGFGSSAYSVLEGCIQT